MATRSRYYRRKYSTKSASDHILFAGIILLAAALYAHHFTSKQHILHVIELLIGSVGFIILIACCFSLFLKVLRAKDKTNYESHVDGMTGREFELYISDILPYQGFRNIILTEHYDRGIDIVAEKHGYTWGIQIKRSKRPISIAAIRQVVAAMNYYDCSRAMVITNSTFTSRGYELAASNDCVLIDGTQLLRWSNPMKKV